MHPDTGPCEVWDVTWCTDVTGISPAVTGMAAEAATEALWMRSGKQFGFCDVSLRPCRSACFNGPAWGWPNWWWDDDTWLHPELIDGTWINLTCGVCLGECGCSQVEEVVLPGPIWGVLQVTVNGDVLSADAYRLDDRRKLVRTDGDAWPVCQDWGKSEGPGTWIVTARFGSPVPSLGLMAVSELASELVLACQGSDECQLPRRSQSIVRNGVTILLDDTNFLFDKSGATGLPVTDMFLSTYNPHGNRIRSRVFSPDRPLPRVTTDNILGGGPFDVIDGGDL